VTEFWQDKSLQDLSSDEWEALCDGCGRCCLNKLEDEDTAELYFTNVACRLLELNSCRCRDYAHRAELVPECLVLSTGQSEIFEQLPSTCAYRLRAEGRPLPGWHPLVSGDPESVHVAGISVRGKVVSEEYIHPDQLPEHMISWVVPGRGKYTL
jgi:uncharacterized cysteine cluster protein YcgN (CxxCxxCC family)